MIQKIEWKKLQNGSDIRGVALPGVEGQPVNLTPEAASFIGAAFGLWLSCRTGKDMEGIRVAIGRDSRLSGLTLLDAAAEGLQHMGVTVTDCGLCSTPAMFMTLVTEGFQFDGSIMVTASHLPFNRNGLKFFVPEGGLDHDDITALLDICEKGEFPIAVHSGKRETLDFLSVYANGLVDKIRRATGSELPLDGLRIVVDAGNGAGGFYAQKVLKPLGADTEGSQYLDPDGNFPNHIPNPEDATAMAAIREAVLQNHADLGIIFDTDVDRAAVVDNEGQEINRNRIIALLTAILLSEHPGTTIVTDSVTSSGLASFIQSLGGVHHRFKRGYKNVINEAIRLNGEGIDCQAAIETSGHGALKENYFLDDGAYLVSKILVQMAKLRREGRTIGQLIDCLDEPAEAAEVRFPILSKDFKSYGQKVLNDLLELVNQQPNWILAPDNREGVRVSFGKEDGDGWFLLRLSLHDPILPLNIESDQPGGVKIIAQHIHSFLSQYDGLDISPLTRLIQP
ncbi:Phosphomannomutase/phosphoglucomutase [Eubacteriaceae bacterium CHKCI005]|nr:Phosphomannomutase/phosphoglucomutase [Eubacteriaceae bacterium CHKCI005]